MRTLCRLALTVATACLLAPVAHAQTLSLNQRVFTPGEEIRVAFTAPASYASDAWVGILPASVPHGDEAVNDQHDITYQYLSQRTSGVLVFQAPAQVGLWDLRMHDTDASGREVASVTFEVRSMRGGNEPPRTNLGSFAGNWDTDCETDTGFVKVLVEGLPVSFRQEGSRVQGSYPTLFGTGTLTGDVTGNTLQGTWRDATGSGLFRFTLVDSSSFTGAWYYADGSFGGSWNGRR
jgi:hypothetical protein